MASVARKGLSRAWFILPSLLVLAAVLLAGVGIMSFVNVVRSDFHAYQPNSSISVTGDGFTLYAQDSTLGSADLRCTATGPGRTVQLPRISGRTALSNGQGTFMAIASTPQGLPAGRYVISCVSAIRDTNVPLYLGPRLELAAVGRLVAFGIIAPVSLGACAVVFFVILAILRHRSRRIATSTV